MTKMAKMTTMTTFGGPDLGFSMPQRQVHNLQTRQQSSLSPPPFSGKPSMNSLTMVDPGLVRQSSVFMTLRALLDKMKLTFLLQPEKIA